MFESVGRKFRVVKGSTYSLILSCLCGLMVVVGITAAFNGLAVYHLSSGTAVIAGLALIVVGIWAMLQTQWRYRLDPAVLGTTYAISIMLCAFHMGDDNGIGWVSTAAGFFVLFLHSKRDLCDAPPDPEELVVPVPQLFVMLTVVTALAPPLVSWLLPKEVL